MTGGGEDARGWRKSSFSGTGNCVEVYSCTCGDCRSTVHVRHSRRPGADRLVFTRPEWQAFLDGVRAGEFDL